MADRDEERVERPGRLHDTAVGVRGAIAGVLGLALVAFIIDNRDDVRVGWVFGDGSKPLWLVLVVTAAVGVLIGLLLAHRSHRR